MYLNTQLGFENFKMTVEDDIFIDKSMLIEELNKCINKKRKFTGLE